VVTPVAMTPVPSQIARVESSEAYGRFIVDKQDVIGYHASMYWVSGRHGLNCTVHEMA
jgi:hypothetical protein